MLKLLLSCTLLLAALVPATHAHARPSLSGERPRVVRPAAKKVKKPVALAPLQATLVHHHPYRRYAWIPALPAVAGIVVGWAALETSRTPGLPHAQREQRAHRGMLAAVGGLALAGAATFMALHEVVPDTTARPSVAFPSRGKGLLLRMSARF